MKSQKIFYLAIKYNLIDNAGKHWPRQNQENIDHDKQREGAMLMNEKTSSENAEKLPYEKPELQMIEISSQEVLGTGIDP